MNHEKPGNLKNGQDKPAPKSNVRGIRLIIAVIAILFVFFVMMRIFLDESKNFSLPLINSGTMFMALWVIIILFSLTFLFILIRNLIKLYFDRKKPYKGGRFKNRLVFFFISFSIVPTLLLFFFATDLLINGIDKWFKADIDSIMTKFEDLNKSYYDKAKDDLKHFARLISDSIQYYQLYKKENRHFLHNRTREMMMQFNLDVVNIYIDREEEVSLLSPTISLREYKDLPQKFIFSELGGGTRSRRTP
jgi:two-component system nitrogen regulation sensor histidine kinase NtrY